MVGGLAGLANVFEQRVVIGRVWTGACFAQDVLGERGLRSNLPDHAQRREHGLYVVAGSTSRPVTHFIDCDPTA